jgi:hypothetical protein
LRLAGPLLAVAVSKSMRVPLVNWRIEVIGVVEAGANAGASNAQSIAASPAALSNRNGPALVRPMPVPPSA